MIHYPTLYSQVTGRKPSTEPSRFSGQWSEASCQSTSVCVWTRSLREVCCSPHRTDQVLGADGVPHQSGDGDAERAAGGPQRGHQDERTVQIPGVRGWAARGAGAEVQAASV